MSSKRPRLTEGPVGRHLVDMTIPVLFGISTIMAQSLIDTWFIGQIGKEALAAFGFGFPIIMMVVSVAIGLGAGTSSVVARALGRDNHDRARRLSTDSLILSFVLTLVIAVVGMLTIEPLFTALGAPDDMLPMIGEFMTIMYLGVPFIVVGMVGMASMRATGDTKLPGKLMVGGAVLNVVLDPILIFGFGPIPAFGLNGAALAALAARVIIFVVTVYFLKKADLVSFGRPSLDEFTSSTRDVLHVGVPAAGTNIIVPLGATLVTAMLARFGPDAVAGFAVAGRIESMVLVVFYALSSIIGPFVGQNLSSLKEDRILESLKLCTLASIGIGLAITILLGALSWTIPGWFTESESVMRVTRLFLWIVPVSYATYGMVMIMNAAFNGLGHPMPGVWVSTGRILLLYVPLAWIGGKLFDIPGIFAAYTFANIVTGIVAYVWARRVAIEACEKELATVPAT